MDSINKRSIRIGTDTSISQKLQQYMQILQFFDEDLEDYIYIYDLTAGRVFLTDKFREKFPIPQAGADGNAFSDWNHIVYPKDRHLMNHYHDLLIKGKIDGFDIAYRIFDKEEQKVWVKVKGSLRYEENTGALLLVGYISEMALGSMVDVLTGLYSTEKFLEDMKQCLKMTDGYLMVLGIDYFKTINITRGRIFGDSILKKVADVLDEYTQYPTRLYRLDGDCFAVCFRKKQQKDVEEFYGVIKKRLEQICTVSAGVVGYTGNDIVDSEEIYMYAEDALDQAKKEGKNRMIFFSVDAYQRNLEQVELLTEMRASIQAGCKDFQLHYQPQIDSQNMSIHGVEALLRYESPSKGKISPVDFISLLEETGLICTVGEWVLKTAVLQCKKWRKYIPDLHVSVNISYVQLQQEEIADIVLNILKEAELPGDALTLEVTESIQLQDYLYYNKIFYKWKKNGIKVSIDDFGTGYSSLSYLKWIEIDEVKIDRCFVDHVQYNAYNFRLLNNIIELAHSAKIKACCEGVETLEELMALQELHTDLLQGYLFAKPYTKEEFEESYINKESKVYCNRMEREDNFRNLESNENKKILKELRNEEIGNITESMDEMVYVSDVDTHELYYLNAAGRRLTGVYDYKGCKCYKVLQGRDIPCEFCTNTKLCKEKFHIWELYNSFLGRHFILKDKLIPWQGKMARVEMAFDITETEMVSESIQKKLDLEQAIEECCKSHSDESDIEALAHDVLKIIREFSNSKNEIK